MDTVEQELTIPQTDAEKIDWLWSRVEELHQANLNFASENKILESRLESRDEDNARLRESLGKMSGEVATMGREMNEARAAAATAVEDYRNNTST